MNRLGRSRGEWQRNEARTHLHSRMFSGLRSQCTTRACLSTHSVSTSCSRNVRIRWHDRPVQARPDDEQVCQQRMMSKLAVHAARRVTAEVVLLDQIVEIDAQLGQTHRTSQIDGRSVESERHGARTSSKTRQRWCLYVK